MSPPVTADVVWVEPWEPSRHLRTVRHQINNLLAPVVVAAELLDDGSETAELLSRSVARLRDVSNRMGELLHLGVPTPRVTLLDDLVTACGLTPPTLAAGRSLRVDPERLLTNVFSELSALHDDHVGDPARPGVCEVVATPERMGAGESLRVSYVLPSRIAVEDPSDLAVPFALPGVDVRLATVCRESVLQGGLVGYEVSSRTLSVYFPLV